MEIVGIIFSMVSILLIGGYFTLLFFVKAVWYGDNRDITISGIILLITVPMEYLIFDNYLTIGLK